jgi:CBS-domain-containing membrane protein
MTKPTPLKKFIVEVLGIDLDSVSHHERWLSMLGGFTGIFAILLVNNYFLSGWGAVLLIASIGSSAVLLFAVPHGKPSQPWPLIGGHLVSALAGVTCAKFIPDSHLAAALAVGLAIGAMHYLRCIHPPGGATALAAVIGGEQLHALGYQFLIMPVLINVVIILLVAVLFNFPFPARRYPQGLQHLFVHEIEDATELMKPQEIHREDIAHAIQELDIVVDVTDEDLAKLFRLAARQARNRHLAVEQILLGHYYSNGGDQWSVRQIVDESMDRNQLIYRIVAGTEHRGTGVCTLDEFARWARYEVIRDGNHWQPAPA